MDATWHRQRVGAREVIQAWGKILTGYRPNLSIEITKECPLTCPGCYAYGDEHLGGDVTLRGLADYKGDELVTRFMALIDRHKPLHVSIVGGEPLVRYRELGQILPQLAERGIHAQVVTSAVRPIPAEWAGLPRLQVVVSIDGLPAEHDVRRTPATYERILKHIVGHQITVHCTVTRQQVRRDGYLEEFLAYWQQQPEHASGVDEPVHAADRRAVDGAAQPGRSRPRRRRPAPAAAEVLEAADARRRCSTSTRSRPIRPSTASSRRRRSAFRRIWSATSRRVSSAATPTATTAAAWRRRDSKPSDGTASRAEFRSAGSSTRH